MNTFLYILVFSGLLIISARSDHVIKNKMMHILWELPLWKTTDVRDDVNDGRLKQFLNIVIFRTLT